MYITATDILLLFDKPRVDVRSNKEIGVLAAACQVGGMTSTVPFDRYVSVSHFLRSCSLVTDLEPD